ncbi:MAG: carbon-nitrogen hydrolase family protein [Acidocella sp.]|nr:carbon-nitrogen hydrolase family protein [Acidocella sp.]
MRVTVVQMSPGADKAANIAQARTLIESALSAQPADLVALPEIWTCLGGNRDTKFAAAETLPQPGEPGGPAYEFLRGIATSHKTHVHGGSMGELAGDRLFNTSVVFNPDGTEIARYRKIHLFDTIAPDGQGYHESATYGAGSEIVTCTVAGLKLGLAICYDVRFPELFLALRQQHVDLIMLPAAFTLATGKDHWEVLLRARAIETQTWFAAPACTGTHIDADGAPRHTYGHSMIVDPWGHVVARASDGPGWASSVIDRSYMARIRANMPVLAHRR